MQPKILLITGTPTSGKGTFTSLLDDHDDIFAIPAWHDKLLNAHLYIDNIESRGLLQCGKYAHLIEYLHKILANSDWHILRVFAFQQELIFPLNSLKSISIPFNLDFEMLNENILLDLSNIQKNDFTCSKAFYVVIKNLIKSITPEKKIKYFISQGLNGFYDYELFFKKYPNSKAIYLKREPIDWLFSWINRTSGCEINKFKEITLSLKQRQHPSSNFIFNSLNSSSIIEHIQKKYPDRLMIVNFNDVILNTKKTMNNVAEFIKIKKLDTLYTSSILGNKIEAIGTIEDDTEKMMTVEHKKLLKKLIASYFPNDNKNTIRKIIKYILPYGIVRSIQKY